MGPGVGWGGGGCVSSGPSPPPSRACTPEPCIMPPTPNPAISRPWQPKNRATACFAATCPLRGAKGSLFQERTELSQIVEVLDTQQHFNNHKNMSLWLKKSSAPTCVGALSHSDDAFPAVQALPPAASLHLRGEQPRPPSCG